VAGQSSEAREAQLSSEGLELAALELCPKGPYLENKLKVVAGKVGVTTFGLRERSYLSIFAEKRRKVHFFVETVTLPLFGSSAVSPSQRFETLWF
jgi:hypothetical protein